MAHDLGTPTALLGELLTGMALPDPLKVIEGRGLAIDSRSVKPGDLFLAFPGLRQDGRDFIAGAVANGAVAVVAESAGLETPAQKIPVIPFKGLSDQISALAGRYYRHPSRDMQLVAVTGTNGKTTCTHLLAQLLAILGEKAAVVGTLGYGPVNKSGKSRLADTGLTTPGALQVQQILAEFRGQGLALTAMEVSSHSLDQGRIAALDIDTAIFTNLSRDHLDYHGSLSNYARAKSKLFAMKGLKNALINIDDPAGEKLVGNIAADVQCLTYSASGSADICATEVQLIRAGVRAKVTTPWGDGQIKSRLLGGFNLSNLLAVLGAACVEGYPFEAVLKAIEKLKPIAGRMDVVDPRSRPCVVVDYAHTPDALEKVLKALKPHCAGDLWCVFGCGGDRDRGKREEMGAIASRLADRVVVTSDNPRNEEPGHIIKEIVQGIVGSDHQVIADRAEAITQAIRSANPEDTVLIAGKGHEEYQQVGEQKLPFSDFKQARLTLRHREATS